MPSFNIKEKPKSLRPFKPSSGDPNKWKLSKAISKLETSDEEANRIDKQSEKNKLEKTVRIFEKKPDNDFAFAVYLSKTLKFPDESETMEGVHNLAVHGAKKSNGIWSWLMWDAGEKEIVGDAMLEFGCDINDWYWCVMYKQEAKNAKS